MNITSIKNTTAARAYTYLCIALVCAASLPAFAHVTLEYPVANAGSYYKGTFKVGHGCNGSPTRQMIINIPATVESAKPMPKAGWSIEISREKLAQPRKDHGKSVTEEVSRITWTANTPSDFLQNDWYDEFVVQVKLPNQAGILYWQVSQICETGKTDWVEVPKPGQKLIDFKNPAAALEVLTVESGSTRHH